jgi:hypothetical protein
VRRGVLTGARAEFSHRIEVQVLKLIAIDAAIDAATFMLKLRLI